MSQLFQPDRVIDERDKSFPNWADGLTVDDFISRHPCLDDFATPLLAIDKLALENNLQVMAKWVADHGFELMPHGKTTMAPALWRRQIEAGATDITVATPWQARVALSQGAQTVQLANNYMDFHELTWAVTCLRQHLEQTLIVWADSLDAVEWLDGAIGKLDAVRPLDVLVDLGAMGGRTGARTPEAAMAIASAVNKSPRLKLVGAAGYEGAFGHDRSAADVTRVRQYLDSLRDLFATVREMIDEPPIISAGGSAFFDVVADELGGVVDGTCRVVLRSGAYVTHDVGHYAKTSPLDESLRGPAPHLMPATWGFARVLSRPEPTLALLDGGKRDFPYDEGLPFCVASGPNLSMTGEAMSARPVTALNDQHAFVTVEPGELPVGTVVRLGLSHPCTTFDKWRLVPVADGDQVVDVVETCF